VQFLGALSRRAQPSAPPDKLDRAGLSGSERTRLLQIARRGVSRIWRRLPRARFARGFEVAVESLRTDTTRTRAALVAFALAMAILVCLTALVERGRAATIRALERAGLRNVYLLGRATSSADPRLDARLTAADVARIRSILPVERAAVIRVGRRASTGSSGESAAPLYAVAGSFAETFGNQSRSGRLIAHLDVDRKAPVCVIGSAVRSSPGLPGSDRIARAGGQSYRVVGQMRECESENVSAGEIPSLDWNRAVVVPLGTEPDAALEPDARYPADVAVLSFRSVGEADRAVAFIERLDPERYRSGAVRIASPVQTLRQYRQTRRTFDRLIWLVAFLTAASAVVGISNILSASVIARTREIGLRRAVGARSLDIVRQFQAEGVVLGALGGGAGLVAGLLISLLLTRSSGPASAVSALSLCGLAAACLAMGVLAGLRPSLRAARIDPAAALREG